MFPAYFVRMANYNAWANRILYMVASDLSEEMRDRDVAAHFGSLTGVLNHMVVTDRIWMRRLTGEGETYADLRAVPFPDFAELKVVRKAEDARIRDWVSGLTDSDFQADFEYANMAGDPFTDRLDLLLGHFFNHQTHHRGQAHGIISALGHEAPSLDLIYFSRV